MNKFMAVVLLLLAASLSACGNKSETSSNYTRNEASVGSTITAEDVKDKDSDAVSADESSTLKIEESVDVLENDTAGIIADDADDIDAIDFKVSDIDDLLGLTEKDVVTRSELADMMNSFISDDDEKWLMFNAKFSSADEVYESIYRQAKSSIYVVDNYIGLRTLVHPKNSPVGVSIILFSDNVGNNKLHNIEYTDFRKEYPTVKLSMKKTGGIFHDRFIVLDYGTAKYDSVIAGLLSVC